MEPNPYEAPQEVQIRMRAKAKYLPALLLLLAITVAISIALIAKAARFQQAAPAQSPVPKLRALAEG